MAQMQTFDLAAATSFTRSAALSPEERDDVCPAKGDLALLYRGNEVFWNADSPEPALVSREKWPTHGEGVTPIFLGKQATPTPDQTAMGGGGGFRVFALDLPPKKQAAESGGEDREAAAAANEGAQWCSLRSLLARADGAWLSVAGLGSAMVAWTRANKFCGACGRPTLPVGMGAQRQCSGSGDAQGCGRKAYPRTDPVVIVSVVDEQEGKLLLGRGARFPPGFFSCLAGFVEPCESVEAAAAREVFEETGLALDRKSIAVEQSQPWPIGRALSCELMVGMRARTAVAGASLDLSLLSLQEEEVAEVKWVTRDECKQALLASTKKGSSAGQLLGPNKAEGLDWFVPGPYAIAHHLIASFAAEGDKEGDSSGACGEGVGVQQQSEADGHRNSGPKL